MFHLPGEPQPPTYGRSDNPTWDVLEHALGHLEDAPAVVFPSGMAAISAAFFALLRAGDRVLLPSDGYYTTRVLADRVLARFGVTAELRPTAAYAEGGFEGFALVFVETPSNPGLDVCDLRAVTSAVREAGGRTVADNTTMTPYGQRPLDLGADVVVAADTKAPGGHSDLLMGHVASRDAGVIEAVREWRKLSGAIPGPFEAWLTHRGLETLELRFDRMCRTAETLAPRLQAHRAVRAVRHPSLPGDPSAALARAQMTRCGLPDRGDARRCGNGRAVHRRLPAVAAGHLLRRDPFRRRAPRPLGRRRGAGIRAAVGRLRTRGRVVAGGGGGAGRALNRKGPRRGGVLVIVRRAGFSSARRR